MLKTDDSVWSFNLRSYNPRDFSDSDSDDIPVDNPCSDGSTLVDHSLSEDNDTAVFKANPWSIARINAASRVAQKYALHFRALFSLRTVLRNADAHISHVLSLWEPSFS